MTPAAHAPQFRVLTLLPTARDAELTGDLLARDGIGVHTCGSDCDLADEITGGVGAVIVGEEVLADGVHSVLAQAIREQPRWSDLPILLLTRSGPSSQIVEAAVATLGNVTLLERPLRIAGLLSTVRAALRARSRQYQIQEYLDALEQARAAERDHARRKDEFLAMLGHELRNPLAPIRNALGVLEVDDSDPARRKQLRGMMLRQVDHMVRLVDDLLEASRLSQGKIALRRRGVDLRQVLADAVELAGRAPGDGRAPELKLDMPPAPLQVDADPVRLAQVFGNLLNNAMRYGKPGGVIEVRAREVGGQVVASVRDDGVGIESDVLPHVFELFTQGRREEHRLHDGLGIGLALVQRLVEMHGGNVEARSDGKGHGAEFTVRLPCASARHDPRITAEHPALNGAEDRPLKVLVVDDNRDAAESMCMLLEAMGLQLASAYGGESALALAAEFSPDVALLDVGMPGMDGYELARALRTDRSHDGLVIAAMTGWGEERDRQRAREAGFDHHFSKPADIKALTRMLETVHPRPTPATASPVAVAAPVGAASAAKAQAGQPPIKPPSDARNTAGPDHPGSRTPPPDPTTAATTPPCALP